MWLIYLTRCRQHPNKMWSKKQEDTLTRLFNTGMSNWEIAKYANWTEDSVRNKLKRLSLERPTEVSSKPKILLFDIENSPLTVYTWGLFDQNIWINQIKKDWYIISWSAKWLGGKKTISSTVSPQESLKQNDKRIVKELWNLVNEADILIGHNAKAFDVKKMNARFLKYGLPEPRQYKVIDTLTIARRNFAISSNKLDYLCSYLGLDRKIQTWWFELWELCMQGDKKALKIMETYCQNDVIILEELYMKLRVYDKTHPNVWLYIDDDELHCPRCGSTRLRWSWTCVVNSNMYKTAKCECWASIRSSKAITSAERKETLMK